MPTKPRHETVISPHGSENQPLTVRVHGRIYRVPEIFPAFYPNEVVRWEPEPDGDDFEGYSDWGRQHYGDDWYRRRKLIIEERNIFIVDRKYKKQQLELREVENTVDGRVFPGGMQGAVWREVWQKICLAKTDRDWDGGDDMRRTDGCPGILPSEDRPWERLEYDRRTQMWNDEEYAYYRCLLTTELVAKARSDLEDQIGDRQHEQVRQDLDADRQALEASPLDRNSVAYERILDAFNRKSDRLKKLERGVHKKRAQDAYEHSEQTAKKRNAAADELLQRGPKTEAEMMEKLMHWQRYGLTLDEHDHLTRLYRFKPPQRPTYSASPHKYNGYDYLSLCKWTPRARPRPLRAEMDSLAAAWGAGLILNEREIRALCSLYGYSSRSTVQDTEPPTSPKSPRKQLTRLKQKLTRHSNHIPSTQSYSTDGPRRARTFFKGWQQNMLLPRPSWSGRGQWLKA
ncbi:hypothetical protein F503_01653 [Ophiostoma piceae UAMH 11346]|uniref:Uncharacterized protein n=1 Tax=Ophiostoma piceae (strain UAMH 11346) TaxID=1262450 RepID=S3BR54_OPHP1|nr:hypothetical protein F503_01653 [Ophiostoma piceae UAMH 11346]